MSQQDVNHGKSMLVTHNVVRDLVPLYFEGEASADSRALVEKWFATDPDFARSARKQLDVISAVTNADAGPVSEEAVRRSLRRAHRIILFREVSLGLAGALTLFFLVVSAFVALSESAQPHLAANGILALTICFVLAATNWTIYFKVRRETGASLP